MKHKKLLRPDRLRRPPERFSWLDHRLVREGRLRRCTPEALALYLFLLVVADAEGLSYYAEASCAERLGMDIDRVRSARTCLIREDLIAYEHPFYQVLSLDRPTAPGAARRAERSVVPPPSPPARSGQARSFADILSGMGGPS